MTMIIGFVMIVILNTIGLVLIASEVFGLGLILESLTPDITAPGIIENLTNQTTVGEENEQSVKVGNPMVVRLLTDTMVLIKPNILNGEVRLFMM